MINNVDFLIVRIVNNSTVLIVHLYIKKLQNMEINIIDKDANILKKK